MSKLNSNLVLFSGLFLLFSVSAFAAFEKFLSLTLLHTVYFCQSFIQSFSIHIPSQSALVLVGLFSLLLMLAGIKIFIAMLHIYRFRRNIIVVNKIPQKVMTVIEKLKLSGRVNIIQNKNPFAVCAGIRHPKIYISTALVKIATKEELKGVLLHEYSHLKNKDALTLFLASLTETLFPFFPIVSDFLKNFRIEREIRADKDAIIQLGKTKPLISVIHKLLDQPTFALPVVPALLDHHNLEPRINALVKGEVSYRKFRLKNIALTLFSVFIFLGIAIIPAQATEVHNNNEDVMMLCPLVS